MRGATRASRSTWCVRRLRSSASSPRGWVDGAAGLRRGAGGGREQEIWQRKGAGVIPRRHHDRAGAAGSAVAGLRADRDHRQGSREIRRARGWRGAGQGRLRAADAARGAWCKGAAPLKRPSGGLAAAVPPSPHELVFACAADMPFAPDAALIDALVAALTGHDAAVPEGGAALQPLCAVWRRDPCLRAADELLAGPRAVGPRAILQYVRWVRLAWGDGRPFLDADTPQALRDLDPKR